MYRIYSRSNVFSYGRQYVANTFYGGETNLEKPLHITSTYKYPQVALKLPTNIVDINAAEMARFSPLRSRDIAGPVISSYYDKRVDDFSKIDITVQADPHVNKYDCRGAVSLSSSMQSNVPSPFSGNHTHLNMPGSQWGQGYKYLSDHLQSAHYLTLRNEYRAKHNNLAVAIGYRSMSTDTNSQLNSKENVPLTSKEKLKKAVKDYGSTVIVFHVTISLMSLGGCYLLISRYIIKHAACFMFNILTNFLLFAEQEMQSDFYCLKISGVDLVAMLRHFNIGEGTLTKLAASNAGTFVIAYAVHKCFAPVRMAITLTATPFIVRYLRNIGFLKHVKK